MLSIRSTSFPARLKRLSATAFADLIEALWRARGYAVERDDDVFVVTNGSDERTLWLCHTRRSNPRPVPPDRPIDLVVTNRAEPPPTLPPGSPRVITPADLEEMLLYAIDRETAEDIAERSFGVTDLEEIRADPRRTGRSRASMVVGGAVMTLALVAVVFTAMVVLPGSLSGDVSVEAIASAAQGPSTERTPPGTERTETRTTERAGDERIRPIRDTAHAAYFLEYGDPLSAEAAQNAGITAGFPTGLAAAGIQDADVIAENHARLIDNRSYRVEIEYQEFRDQEVQSTYVERIAVESPSRYVSTIEETGERAFSPPVIAETAVFADGQTVTTRDGENYSIPTVPGMPVGYYTDRIATYLRWYLSVEESAVVDLEYRGTNTHYIIGLGPDPWPGRVDSSGFARIDDRGIVHYVRVKYRIPESETTAEITIRYVKIGDVEVSPPAWYQNGTQTPISTLTPAD